LELPSMANPSFKKTYARLVPRLNQQATARINHPSLALLLYFLGLTEEEQLQLDILRE
jgi:hypothetical protein